MYNIVTLDKEKIEELKLEKREVLVYTFISLVSGSYTAKEMAAILGIVMVLVSIIHWLKSTVILW